MLLEFRRDMWMGLCGAVALTYLAGCQPSAPPPAKTVAGGATQTSGSAATAAAHDAHDHEGHHHHDHGEKGPHEGTLIAIGGHDAHVELLLDPADGKLTAYVLDGAAKQPLRAAQKTLVIGFMLEDPAEAKDDKEMSKDELKIPEPQTVTLEAVNPDDHGFATEFAGRSEQLKGVKKFEGTVDALSVNGKDFKNVLFEFPEGNEDHHHH